MIISPPFLPQSGLAGDDDTDTDRMMTVVEAYEPGYHGLFPVAFDRRWHCGIHLVPDTVGEPVRAIADGEVVAYRVSQDPISDGHIDETTGQEVLNTNVGFVLLRHVTNTGHGRILKFYSLYMNLLDLSAQQQLYTPPAIPQQNTSPTALAAWLLEAGNTVTPGNGKKVYRKDILGYWGQSQGLRHLHFEIFMTEEDFNSWFNHPEHIVQLGQKNLIQPTSSDWWGHAYYVIPGSIALVDRPGTPHDATWFPKLNAGKLANTNSKLYVESYFHVGQRYLRAWLDENGDGNYRLLTQEPIKDPYDDYEYKLYERSMALYPGCPSDGYELLRFGRILSPTPTLTSDHDKATWVAVPFDESGSLGYVDLNQPVIVKLSDADFPFFAGWQKIDGSNAPLDGDGLFIYNKLSRIIGDASADTYGVARDDSQFSLDEQMNTYIQGSDAVRAGLSGFVCQAKSEWDPANNDARYQGLNKPDGYFGRCKETNPDGYDNFLGFVTKIQFMDQTPTLSGGQRFWYFHPLAFIRHFRKCGWLSANEIAQCIPRTMLSLHGMQFTHSSHAWRDAMEQGGAWENDLNAAMRKYSINSTKERATHFLAQLMEESGWLKAVREYHGESRPYSPYYGRGLIQLTKKPNYDKYGDFKKFKADPSVPAKYASLKWNPDVLLADTNVVFNRQNCADSAGLYWTCKTMTAIGVNTLKTTDRGGLQIATAVQASRSTNGNVANENINGLEHRLQSFVYIKYVLLDVIESGGSEQLSFVWRRNSAQEPVLDVNGHPIVDSHTHHPKKKYIPTTHDIQVSLERQRP